MNKSKLKITLGLMLILSVIQTFAQTVSVRGVVKDKQGPLSGVAVKVNDGTNGTMTNLNGEYTIQSPAKGILKFSFMGYEAKTVSVDGKRTINVTLVQSSVDLDEVVVVGYGTQKKRDITGSIVSINAAEIQKNSPTNIGEALQGKVAGLSIITSSEPGKDAQFKIRGISTLGDESGSTPLFIVDGMEVVSISNINPKDIESIEILKDGASAAIYGSRSANGVILVTTKQGVKGKPLFNVNYSVKMSHIAKTRPQMNRLESYNYNEIRSYLEGTPNIYAISDTLSPIYMNDYFYQDELFRTALTHQLDLSISGAENKIKFYSSVGFLSDDGIYVNTYNRRLNARINAEYQVTPKLSVGVRISPSVSDARIAPWGANFLILSRASYVSLINPSTGEYMPYINGAPSLLGSIMLGKNDRQIFGLDFNQFLLYQFNPSLKFNVSFTASMNQTNAVQALPGNMQYTGLSTAANKGYTNVSWNQDNILSYNKQFNKAHNVEALLGVSLRQNTRTSLSLSTSGMPYSIEMANMYSLINNNGTFATWSQNSMASAFTRLGYNYKGRYTINSSIRADGSSRFGSNNRWGLFPSVSAGWRLSDESFMSWTKPLLKDAKIRLSYAITGNQTAGDFASMRLYQSSYYGAALGVIPTQLENKDLGWETTTQSNAGIDIMLAEGRIVLTADVYNKYTTGILYNVRLPQTSGFATTYKNAGDVSNQGVEASLRTVNIKGKDWEWSTSFNFGINKNMIAYIPPGTEQFVNDIYYMAQGYEVGTMYGYKALGIYSNNESNAYTADWQRLTPVFNANGVFQNRYTLNGKPSDIKPADVKQMHYDTSGGQIFKAGDVIWDDIDKDGVVGIKDRQVIGHGMPNLTGGFQNDLKYKNFSLSFFFNYSFGNDVYNYAAQSGNSYTGSANSKVDPVIMQNSWLAPGDVKKYPAPAKSLVGNTRVNSSLWIEDGSFIRLSNVKLSYTCPQKLIGKLKLKGLTLSVQGNNLLTWTNYSGFDPEVSTSSFTAGYDYGGYPRARTVLMGININL